MVIVPGCIMAPNDNSGPIVEIPAGQELILVGQCDNNKFTGSKNGFGYWDCFGNLKDSPIKVKEVTEKVQSGYKVMSVAYKHPDIYYVFVKKAFCR